MTIIKHNTTKQLQWLAKRERRPRVARRMQIIAIAQQGRTGAEIAELMGESQRSVQRWVARYNTRGIDGLDDRPRPGRPQTLSRDQQQSFMRRLDAGPARTDAVSVLHGRDIQRILEQEFDAIYTLDGVYKLLHRLGYSWLCPRPQHEHADPQAQEEFKKNQLPDRADRSRASRSARRSVVSG